MNEPSRDVSAQPGPAGTRSDQAPFERWRLSFPFHWDADELVSRRELLAFTVYASATMFTATFLLAVLGWVKQPVHGHRMALVRASELPEGGVHYFDYPGPDQQAMLLHLPGGRFVAYSLRCTHLSCAVYYRDESKELICPCHHGVFQPETGDPVAGPPRRRLEQIALEEEDGMLYAVDIAP